MPSIFERLYFLSERNLPVVRTITRWLESRHPVLLGQMDHLVPGRLWYPLDGPMNGQRARCQLVRDIASQVRFRTAVETGTFLGATTEFLYLSLGCPVWSAEIRPRYWGFSAHRFRGLSEVHVVKGDSRALLTQLARNEEIRRNPTFFYLDAHWYEDLPLWGEISFVLEEWERPIIMVDDFQVPGDPGYGFDVYGADQDVTLDGLRRHVRGNAQVVFRTTPSSEETGAKRGFCLIGTRGMLSTLKNLPLTEPVVLRD